MLGKLWLAGSILCATVLLTAQQPLGSPELRSIQLPFASLKPSATFHIGDDADWVLIAGDSVWVTSSKPNSAVRIDPGSNRKIANIALPGNPCAGLAAAFGSLWVPLCADKPGGPSSLVRIDLRTNQISRVLPFGPAAPEGGIAASSGSIWMVTDEHGTLVRINPVTNTIQQKIAIASGAYNPLFAAGFIWTTGFESDSLIPVDAKTGKVLPAIPVGPKPRFLAAGAGSIWTLNQGDGTLTRVDAQTQKVVATIPLGTPGAGGDIAYGAGSVWTSVFHLPLTQTDPLTDKPLHQWIGEGGDSLRLGFGSIWLTNYHRGVLLRIPYPTTK